MTDYLEFMTMEREAKQWVIGSQYLQARYASRPEVLEEIRFAIRESLKGYEEDRPIVEAALAILNQAGS